MADNFESWLKVNKLSELLPILKENDVFELCDLMELFDDESNIDDFIHSLNISYILQTQFKTALLKNKKISQIDVALSHYYESLGRNDYFNSDKGKFKEFVEVNGFDEKNIEKQLGDHAEQKNCLFLDMDNNFPLIADTKGTQQRNKEIFTILQYFYKYAAIRNRYQNDFKWIQQRASFRSLLKPGFNMVPSEKQEYIIPELKENEYAFRGGTGYAKNAVLIKKTIRRGVNDDEKQLLTYYEREPEKLFADNNHKIILVCGQRGTGKTTLINSMMNYIYDIEADDKFRLKLIDDVRLRLNVEVSHICSYTIKCPRGGNIDYDLTIIDTPGFGPDIGKDMQTVEQFKYIFEKILTNINGICFVVKSSSTRLDALQTYVFNNLLNLWGKNVAPNIFILITFADGGKPYCIDTLNKNNVLRNCKQRFSLNNCAFGVNPLDQESNSNQIYQYFWNLGMECFTKFFCQLAKVEPKTIEHSKIVLRLRAEIQTQICYIVEQLDIALIERYRRRKHIDDGRQLQGFFKYREEEYRVKVKSKYKVLTCETHKRNCHDCYQNDGTGKTTIINSMMNYIYGVKGDLSCPRISDHCCEICGCHESEHTTTHIYQTKTRRVREFDVKKKEEYDAKELEIKKSEKILQNIQDIDCKNALQLVQHLRMKLEKIALRPQLSTVGNLIDELIQIENDPKKIEMLKKLRKQEDVMVKIQSTK